MQKTRYDYRTPVTRTSPPQKTPIILSPQQEAGRNAIRFGTNHVFITARAGTGKSTLLQLSVEGLEGVTVIAFAKMNVKDLRNKGVPAMTCHSLGRSSLPKNCFFDKNKTFTLLRKYLEEDEEYFAVSIKQLVSLSKMTLLGKFQCKSGSWILEENSITDDDLLKLANRFDVDVAESSKRIFQITRMALVDSLNSYVIDYDDMIWWTVIKNLPVKQFKILGIDEAQDLNKAQHALALMAIRNGGRIVATGDPFQALYSWRGAELDSMEKLHALVSTNNDGKQIEDLPLTISRRCGKNIIAAAQKIVPDIEAMETAIDGVVETITHEQMMLQSVAGDMIVSRTRAPAIKLAYAFLRNDKRSVVLGTDIGSMLESFIKKFKATDVQSLLVKLQKYEDEQTEKLSRDKALSKQLALLKDRCECIRILSQRCQKVSEMITKIHSLFVDEDDESQRTNAIVLSTVHKAKGLEAKRVFVIDTDKMPHPMATRDYQIEEEKRIIYVAVTRAKEQLSFVGSPPKMFADDYVAPVPELAPEIVPQEQEAKVEKNQEVDSKSESFADESMLQSLHNMKICQEAKSLIPFSCEITISQLSGIVTKISKHIRKCKECGK